MDGFKKRRDDLSKQIKAWEYFVKAYPGSLPHARMLEALKQEWIELAAKINAPVREPA